MHRFAMLLLAGAIVSACGSTHRLTDEERATVDRLRTELTTTESDIASASEEDAKLAGGLVKALIAARLEILRTNKALLQQRIQSIEAGAPVTITVSATKPDPAESERLLAEIRTQSTELNAAREEARQYSGGLVLAMKLSAIATQEQTIALLRQRQLIAQYGLAPAGAGNPGAASATQAPAPPDTNSPTTAKAQPADGPFGFRMGLTKDEIEAMIGKPASLAPGYTDVYLLASAPKPHNAFENYAVVVGEIPGLCTVRGIGKDIPSNTHGHQLQSNFEEMQSVLAEKYGMPKKTDLLVSGSIWREPEDWMMGLAKEERILAAQWPRKNEGLSNDLASITLIARAKGRDTGYLILEYNFSNQKQCEEASKSAKKSAL